MEVSCEYCKKSYAKETILKHIGKKIDCKSFYGDRFEELKKQQQRDKKRNQRKILTKKKKKKVLQKQRDYDQQPKKKERKKQYYTEKKENTKEAKEQEEKKLIAEAKERGKEKRADFAKNYLECENCKKLWDPDSLLKHIGKTEKCKSFYGLRFEKMKRERNRERNEQRKKEYASNPKKKEEKKQYYQKVKKIIEIRKEEREKELKKEASKRSVLNFESAYRYDNKRKYESFQWISNCLRHFFETFTDVDNQTKNKLINLEKSISEKYSNNETEIDVMTKKAKEASDQYDGAPFPNHFKCQLYFKKGNKYFEEIFMKEWDAMKKSTVERFREIYHQVEEPLKTTDWCKSLGKISHIYANKEHGVAIDKYFLEQKVCIICKDRPHRMIFDKDHAAK